MQAMQQEPEVVKESTASVAPLVRRQHIALVVAIACALLATGGMVASFFIKSPQQQLAESGPPQASLITAEVTKRVLESTLVTRGMVAAGTNIEVTPVVEDAGAQVVTAVRVKVGDEVESGAVLVAVSARPLIVLPGALPGYRDLKPASEGTDVKQLQAALASLGYSTRGDKAGYFGPKTKAAVRKLYGKVGYDAADTGGPGGKGDKAALKSAAEAVTAAQEAVDAVQRRINANERVGAAEKPLARQLRDLKRALADAKQARSDLVASTGTMLPLSEFVFVPSLPARVTAFSAKVGDAVVAPLVTLSAGRLAVQVKLRQDQAGLLRPGMPVQLGAETLGKNAAGAVASIGEVTTDSGQTESGTDDPATTGTPYVPLSITPDDTLPAEWAGLDVRVTITAARTDTEVLVVPLSGVSAGADGRTTVSVVDPEGSVTRVEVRAGVSGDGFVEVTPISGTLAEGAQVVVSDQQ
ncbi:peptidoglycan-binding protein [Micromonospora sp. NPDC005205]|uniref:peptidoglycan-binding protein n=1 Tax=Micromonospora sp. NPDC005205 TaxID=3156714 RepID=UPI0033A36BDD